SWPPPAMPGCRTICPLPQEMFSALRGGKDFLPLRTEILPTLDLKGSDPLLTSPIRRGHPVAHITSEQPAQVRRREPTDDQQAPRCRKGDVPVLGHAGTPATRAWGNLDGRLEPLRRVTASKCRTGSRISSTRPEYVAATMRLPRFLALAIPL